MKKKDNQDYIFTLLNDIPEKLSVYPETDLTKEELFRCRESLRQKMKKTKTAPKAIPSPWRYIAAGAAAAVLVTLLLFDLHPHGERSRASSGTNYYSLSSMLGVSSRLEDYVCHIDENHPIRDGSVTLNSAVLDYGQLKIHSTYYYNDIQKVPRLSNGGWGRDYDSTFSDTDAILFKPEYRKGATSPNNANYVDSGQIPYIQRLFINGEEIQCETQSDLYASANGVVQDTATYFFSAKDLEFPAHVTVEIWKDAGRKAPDTAYDFVLKKDNIVPDRKNAALHHKATLPDGRIVTFKRFVYNEMGMWIEAEYEDAPSGEDDYIRAYLSYTDADGSFQFLREHQLDDHRLIFSPDDITSLYSRIDTKEALNFSIVIYRRQEDADGARRIVLEEPLTVPLKE